MREFSQRLCSRLSYALISLSVLCTVCCARPLIQGQTNQVTTDTTLIVETLRDTVIRLEADSSMMRALLECDSLGQVHIKQLLEWRGGDKLKPPEFKIKDNILDIKAITEAYNRVIELKEKHITQLKNSSRQEVKYIEVNRLNSWQNFIQILGYTLGGLLVLIIVYKSIKR